MDDELKSLTMPVMLICGEHDVTLNVDNAAKRLNETAKEAYIRIIKDNGHVVYNIVEDIMKFIKSHK